MFTEGNTFGINGRFGAPGKKINLHHNADNSFSFVNGK